MFARPGNMEQKETPSTDHTVEMYSKLKRYCLFLSKNVWDGEDLAQEAFCRGLDHYKEKYLTTALLKKIAYHLWLDQIKKRNRETVGPIPEEEREEVQTQYDFMEQLSSLTAKQSAIFTLKEGFRFQISEIAEMFQMTETAVKALLHRARRRLDLLTDEKDPPVLKPVSDEEDQLESAIYEAIHTEDPQVLIDQVKVLFPVEIPPTRKSSTPSGFLSMAA
ncbi:sigma factor-like helix-turn-helix DNA-binding protein [Pseudalkalibacillus sp. Hm43]|uniref:sigma factor-like helix-turn-helix DNA-binding protein n=1 Tax=Pseudalkalibacillus sp. Hm43 TaxID=3450742 RepID=UPI003F43E3F1